MNQFSHDVQQALQDPVVAQQLLSYLFPYLTPHKQELFDSILPKRTRHIVAAIEDTYSEHNASAVVRSCECFGVQDVHIIEKQHKYNVAKGIAKGSEKWLDVHIYDEYDDNSKACIENLKKQGYTIAAATPHQKGISPAEFNISQKSAIFFGRELYGVSEIVLQEAEEFINIPMAGFTESFNVSVSAAIVIYELTKRMREEANINWQLTHTEQLIKKLEWTIKTIQNGERLAEKFSKELTQKP